MLTLKHGEMETTIKILHLEDNPKDAQLVQSVLKNANITFEYFSADNEKTYLNHLKNQKIDIILSDFNLPDYSGTGALLYAKSNYPTIPFVFVSGTMGEDAAIESLLNGATDYVLKNKMERLVPAVHRAYNEVQEKKVRNRVEQECQKLSRAVEQSPNSVIIADTKGIIEYVNPSTIKLSGYTKEELVGRKQQIFSSAENPEDEYLLVWENLNTGKMWQGEFRNQKKNGEFYWESASISPIWDANGKITNFVTIKEDITERKKLTHDLIAAKEKAEESDRLKTAFLNNISHEIRTPLNAIVGFSEFLNDPDLDTNTRKQYTDIIIQNSDQLLAIISAIVSISTIEAGQETVTPTEMNLNSTLKLVHDQFNDTARKHNVTLNMIPYLPYEDRIVTDEIKVVQILTNLVSNAVKFTNKGHINFGYIVKNNELEFFVEDTGIGIPIDMREDIFTRFRQVESTMARQYGGTGLGLSISKAYVELLGGKIWVNSELDRGSTFYFTIPYVKGRKTPVAEKTTVKGTATKRIASKTILLAEDEDSNFKLMEALLLNLNVNIIRAITGVEAIQTCKSKHVDAVLMDIKMPVMDGYEATKKIREFMPTVPIIAQTAYASSTDKSRALACGCNDFISKPFRKELFLSKVNEYLYR